jgi:hypothetical protein
MDARVTLIAPHLMAHFLLPCESGRGGARGQRRGGRRLAELFRAIVRDKKAHFRLIYNAKR